VEKEDVVTRAREATGGGAEVVVDTTPYAPQSLNHAVAIALRKGRIVVAGLKGQKLAHELPVDDIIYKELTIRGVLSMSVDDTVPRHRAHRVRALSLREDAHPFVPPRPGRGRDSRPRRGNSRDEPAAHRDRPGAPRVPLPA
jgi:threonine dehydrogenase-like Zn-dependent dehydrogenase